MSADIIPMPGACPPPQAIIETGNKSAMVDAMFGNFVARMERMHDDDSRWDQELRYDAQILAFAGRNNTAQNQSLTE